MSVDVVLPTLHAGAVDWVAVRITVGEVITFIGAIVSIIGAVGVLRFPDFYTRLHAASVTDTGALSVMVLGMVLIAGWSLVSLKLLLLWVFVLLTGPVGSHALANAAYVAGLQPLIGKYGSGWSSKPRLSEDEAH